MTRLGKIKLIAEVLWNLFLVFFLPFTSPMKVKMLLAYIIINWICGRYRHKAFLIWDEVRYIAQAYIGIFLVDLLLFSLHDLTWASFGWLVLYLVLSLIGVLLINRYAHLIFWKFVKENVLIVGTGEIAANVYDVCKHNRFSLLDVRGFIRLSPDEKIELPEAVQKSVGIYPLSELESQIRQKKISTVIVADEFVPVPALKKLMNRIQKCVKKIKYIPVMDGQINFATTIDDFDGQLMISTASGKMTWAQKAFKRMVDILAAIPGVLLLLPMTIYVWHVNRKYHNEGPIFFSQERIGKDGKLFKIYKYRSMVMNADEVLEDMLKKDPKLREEYEKNKKLEHDPRIIPAWDRLRRKNVDEFPQFINVLKGDMSLIGPRPYLPREQKDMDGHYEDIIQTKPGITGMWQTHGRSNVDFERRLELDSYYYHNWSTWLDLTLLVRTLKMLLSREDNGAR